MEAALKIVQEGGAINKAAADYGVPASTLKDQVSGCVKHGTNPGPKPYLSPEDHHELGSFLKQYAS